MKRSNIKKYIYLSAILFFICACTNPKSDTKIHWTSKHSKWIKYAELKHGIGIEITNPDQINEHFVYYFTKNPRTANTAPKGAIVVNTSKIKIAATSSTHVGMLVELKADSCIKAVSGARFLYNPNLIRKCNQGKILDIPISNEIPYESLVKYGVNIWISSSVDGIQGQQVSRLKQLIIISIPNYEWKETNPLGKAEWLLLFGALTNKFDQAKNCFSLIISEYKKVNKEVGFSKSVKTALVGNFAGEYWYSPAGESYQAALLKDAGIITFSMKSQGVGSMAIDAENIFLQSKNTLTWLNPGFDSKTKILLANPKAKMYPVFNKGKIYCYSHNMNKFWEQSTIKPHLVLRDLVCIQKSQKLNELYFYKEVK